MITKGDGASSGAHLYLLELDPIEGTLRITGFRSDQQEEADRKYADTETKRKKTTHTDAVLVSVESINSLSNAYPRYFADTSFLVEMLSQALSVRSSGIVFPTKTLEYIQDGT